MNTTELRDELRARVSSLDAPPSMSTAVAGRIRVTKRRRAAAVAGAVCAVVALTGVTAVNAGRSSAPVVPAATSAPSVMVAADGMPYRSVPPSTGDVVRDGLRYRAQVADDRLEAATIGALGQNKVTMTWTPGSTRVSLALDCWVPGLDPVSATAPMAWVIVGGRRLYGSGCNASPAETGDLQASLDPDVTGQGWDQIALGRPVTVTVEVLDRNFKPVSDPGLRLAEAVYAKGAQRDVTDPSTGRVVMQVPEVREVPGLPLPARDAGRRPRLGRTPSS